MLDETRLTEDELREIRHLIPDAEPAVEPRSGPAGTDRRIIPVADTRLDGNELRYVRECIESGWISSAGRFVREFETRFAQAVGCDHGVACASGTASLHLTLAALGLRPGDEVIIPTFTMIATANAVAYTGAAPVLVDAEPAGWTLDPEEVRTRITTRTRAIVVMHTYGHPVDMDAIDGLAREHGLVVVEDAAEAHGALYRGRPAGSLGRVASFSFYANKIVTTGEGGMVTTNDPEIARVCRRLRDHAFSEERHFWHTYLGFNYRMSNLQAAVGLAQTERLAGLVQARRATAQRYTERLRAIRGLTLPPELPGRTSAFWMYAVLVEDDFGCTRDELRRRLARRGVETRTFFIPIHLQPIYYRTLGRRSYPVAESLCRKGLYLPSGAALTEADVEAVVEAVAWAQQGGV